VPTGTEGPRGPAGPRAIRGSGRRLIVRRGQRRELRTRVDPPHIVISYDGNGVATITCVIPEAAGLDTEPTDTADTARPLPHGARVSGQLAPSNVDVGWYRVAGSNQIASLDGATEGVVFSVYEYVDGGPTGRTRRSGTDR
jgi:hypothetical protein